jgi:hypothetical protein
LRLILTGKYPAFLTQKVRISFNYNTLVYSFNTKSPKFAYTIFMTIHLIKLSVGPDSLDDLAAWQKQRIKELKAAGKKPELIHVTRHTPKRADEVLDGGSIYWVIKGWIVARQRLLELRPVKKNGVPPCGLVYDKKLIQVEWREKRAFQGWRYFDPKDAPPDRDAHKGNDTLPPELRRELAELGLL